MLPSTVAVRASEFMATSSSAGFNDRNWFVLSAILLKQWRVPSTFSLDCFRTKSRACSREVTVYKFSVPYSTLPAQFFSLLSGSSAKRGETAGPASMPEKSLMKLLLFNTKGQLLWKYTDGIAVRVRESAPI